MVACRLGVTTSPDTVPAPGSRAAERRGSAGFPAASPEGKRAGQRSVRVTGNWRVMFRFEDNEAVDEDLIDYH